jgi:hypothetical protein
MLHFIINGLSVTTLETGFAGVKNSGSEYFLDVFSFSPQPPTLSFSFLPTIVSTEAAPIWRKGKKGLPER